MKKLILLILIIGSIKSLFGQNYYQYYREILKAKESILNDSLVIAVKQYHYTFQKYDFVFARDCYNAIEVANHLNDTNMVLYFMRRGLKQGIPLNLFIGKNDFSHFRESALWEKLLSEKDSLRAIYINSVDWELRARIVGMFSDDQEIRASVFKNRFNIFKIRKLNKQFEAIDRDLVNKLLEVIEKQGFPGEKLIGIDDHSMHPKINTTRLTAGMPIVIFIHHFSQPNPTYNHLLFPEIIKGNISNEHFATICDFQNEYGKSKYSKIPCYSNKFTNNDNVKNIDERRVEIGLLSIKKRIN